MRYFSLLIVIIITCCSVLISYVFGKKNANMDNLVNNTVFNVKEVIPLCMQILMASNKQDASNCVVMMSNEQVENFKSIIGKCNKREKKIMFEQLAKRKKYLEQAPLQTELSPTSAG
jgi:hypothetical protein